MTAPHVLIVDDDPALLAALPEALRLRMAGVTVDTADSGAAALDRIAARDYEAIVIDVKMPGMDGLALLAEIRARRPDTPVLMITGHGEHALAIQALRGGAYDFIQKPIDRDHFVAALSRAMRAHALNRRVKDRQVALERCTGELEQIVEKFGRGSEQSRVLIVDDDPALLQALPQALQLRMAEATVETADSAAVALDRIAARDYDAIVTDIKMPGMDGLALLAEIRRRQPDTPILIITVTASTTSRCAPCAGVLTTSSRNRSTGSLRGDVVPRDSSARGESPGQRPAVGPGALHERTGGIVEKLGRELRGTPLRGKP